MAFNFGEVFLRESGAAQDRAQSMAEMQLRAKQFADDLAFREAQLQFSKEVQSFNEEEARFQRQQQFLDRAQKDRQFKAEIEYKREALQQQKDISEADREAEMKKLDAQVSQWEAGNKIAWANLDQNERQMLLDYGIKVEELGIKKDLSAAEIENIKARTEATRGAEERAQDMAPLNEALLQRQIQAGAIANSLRAIELARETRGEAYLTEQATEETKRLLGLSPDENLTNERAGNLLQTRILEEGLKQKEAATKLSELRTNIEMEPYSQEITQENITNVSNLYSEDVRRSGLRTAFDQFAYSFLNPATLFDVRPKIDFVTAAFGIPAMSATGKYYDLQRATGVDAAEFVDPLAGPQGLLGRSLMESQMTPAQQEYYNYLNRSASLFADPTKEFTQGAYEIQPPFPIPFGPYTNPSSLIPPTMSQDVEE